MEADTHWETLKTNFKHYALTYLDFLIETKDYFPFSNDWNPNCEILITTKTWFEIAKNRFIKTVEKKAPELLPEILNKLGEKP